VTLTAAGGGSTTGKRRWNWSSGFPRMKSRSSRLIGPASGTPAETRSAEILDGPRKSAREKTYLHFAARFARRSVSVCCHGKGDVRQCRIRLSAFTRRRHVTIFCIGVAGGYPEGASQCLKISDARYGNTLEAQKWTNGRGTLSSTQPLFRQRRFLFDFATGALSAGIAFRIIGPASCGFPVMSRNFL